jgi:hypothetical protein
VRGARQGKRIIMTKNRSDKQAARNLADQDGISHAAAARQLRDTPFPQAGPDIPRPPFTPEIPSPDFILSTRLQSNGEGYGGDGLHLWAIEIRTPVEDEQYYREDIGAPRADERKADDHDSLYVGRATAILYPDARNDTDYLWNLDASDEDLTIIGECLGDERVIRDGILDDDDDDEFDEDDAYAALTGTAARRLFARASRPDALLVGEFQIGSDYVDRDYPGDLVNALLASIGTRVGFVAVEPNDYLLAGAGSAAYWRGQGFRRFRKTPTFVRKIR